MKKRRRFLSGFLAVLLCVAINFNPIALIGVAILESEFVQDLGIAGNNIAYMLKNPDVVFADGPAAGGNGGTTPPDGGGGTGGGTGCDCSFECEFDDDAIIEAIETQTSDINEALDGHVTEINDNVIAQTEVLKGSIDSVNASVKTVNNTLLTTIHKDLVDIKNQIELQQHQYRVAHLYSLNNRITNVLWRPTIEEVDYAEDYAYITGKFANIYSGNWNTNITSIDKGAQGAQRALEVLGYDALVRREGIIVTGGFGQIEIDGNKTYGWVNSAGKLQDAWGDTPYDGYATAYELRDRSMDQVRTLYYQELIPEDEITWLDAVTLLYKAVGQEIQSFEAFMIHDASIMPETSPAYQNLSNIVPGYQNPKTGKYEESTYNGFNMYMFFSRSNIVYAANDEGTAISHSDYYWNRAMADGVVLRDNADKKIRGDELFILAAKLMQIYGEPELNQDEIDALLQVYGKDYPIQLGEDVADSWAYLMARGCLEAPISYTGFVSRNDMLDLAMRVKDPDSRMDYKNIQVVLDLADVMISDGWYPVRDLEYTTDASVEISLDYTIQTHYDYLIRKGDKIDDSHDMGFRTSTGIEATDLLVTTDMGANHNVSACSGNDHKINTVEGAEYVGVVIIAGREYYHIKIPKDSGIGTGFKIIGVASDADGKEVQCTNSYAMIPSSLIGGGIYGSWVVDGSGIKATDGSFQTFDQIGSNELYAYTDCIRALDKVVENERKVAAVDDRTIIELMAAGWKSLTTPMYVEAAPSSVVTTIAMDGSGGGSSATKEITLTWKKNGTSENVDGGIEKVEEFSDYTYYKAKEGNSGVARAFRLSTISLWMAYAMEKYDGNPLQYWKENGFDTNIGEAGKEEFNINIFRDFLKQSNISWDGFAYTEIAADGTKSTTESKPTYMDKLGDIPSNPLEDWKRGTSGNTFDYPAQVRIPGSKTLYAFVNAYGFPTPDTGDGPWDPLASGALETNTADGFSVLASSSWWEAAMADYDDIRELLYASGLVNWGKLGWNIKDNGNNTLSLTGTFTSNNVSAALGEFISNGKSADIQTGSATGTYADFIEEDMFSSTVMNRNQNILISFTDLKKAGFVDPTMEKPSMKSDGVYYLDTPKGVVKVNDNTKMISVGGTLYNLANDDGTGPTIAYEDPTQNEWYFDYRCFMGVINTQVYSSTDDGTYTTDGESIGCGGSVIYTISDGQIGSSVFEQKAVNSYNFPDLDGLSTNVGTGTYTVDLIYNYVKDGETLKDGTSTNPDGGKVYWEDGNDGHYRLSLASFNPTANYLLVVRSKDGTAGDNGSASVFVWYPRKPFVEGYVDKDGNVVSEVENRFDRMHGQDGNGYVIDTSNGTSEFEETGGNSYAVEAVKAARKFGDKDLKTLLSDVYGAGHNFSSDEWVNDFEWYDVMTIGAAANLYDWSGGGFYLSNEYVIREFPLTWNGSNSNSRVETRMPYGFQDGVENTNIDGLNSNRVGACYWLPGVGFVYNLPTLDEWDLGMYLSGQVMLPYAVSGTSLTGFKLINFNMDAYGTMENVEGTGGSGPAYGYALADAGLIPWYVTRDISKAESLASPGRDSFEEGGKFLNPTVPNAGDPAVGSGFVFAPSGVYIQFGGVQLERATTKNMTGYVTNANSVYLGSRRILFDKIDNDNYLFWVGTKAYDSVVLNLGTEFFRVHHANNGSDIWVANNGKLVKQDMGQLNPVDVFDNYPNPLKDLFNGLGLDAVLDTIDQGSSLAILFAFRILPIIGIIIMTGLVGLSFVSDMRFVQRICEKTIDPVRILTFKHRDITNWNWRKVLIPCTLLYISFALFLNGNIIRIIQWVAEVYGVLSRMARSL